MDFMPKPQLQQPQQQKPKITLASKVVLAAGLFLSVLLVLLAPKPFNIWAGLYFVVVTSLASYNVNCAQVGHCYLWAWVLTSIFIVSVIMSVVALSTMKSNKALDTIIKSAKKTASSAKKFTK